MPSYGKKKSVGGSDKGIKNAVKTIVFSAN